MVSTKNQAASVPAKFTLPKNGYTLLSLLTGIKNCCNILLGGGSCFAPIILVCCFSNNFNSL